MMMKKKLLNANLKVKIGKKEDIAIECFLLNLLRINQIYL